MDNQQPKRSIISTGTASIVLIFVMLCLLTFSVLSLVSAQANLRLSEKSAARTSDYYTAENQANAVLLSVLETMQQYENSPDADTFFQNIRTALADDDAITFINDQSLSYQVPLGDLHVLSVQLTLSYDALTQKAGYHIDSWNTISEYDWNQEHPLPLPAAGASKEE